jgi:hypothetical protein
MQSGDWHYVRGQQQFGPVPFQVLQSLGRAGDLSADDLVWSEGMPDWVPAQSIQELSTSVPSPRKRSGGSRARSRQRGGRRPASRRPGRAHGAAASTATPHAFGAGPAGLDETAAGRAERRRAQHASAMPGSIITATICDVLVAVLSTILGVLSIDDARELRHLARQQTDQALTNIYWNGANAAETSTTIEFLIAGVFIFVCIALLARQRWGPITQTILSLVATLPFLIGLSQIGKTPRIDIAPGTLALYAAIILLLLLPIGCVWNHRVRDWLDTRSVSRRAGGGERHRRRQI